MKLCNFLDKLIHEVKPTRSLKCEARTRLRTAKALVREAPSIAGVVRTAEDLAATPAPRLALSVASSRVPTTPEVAEARASLAPPAVAITLVTGRGFVAALDVARVARLEAASAAAALAVVRVAVRAAPRPRPIVGVHVVAVLLAPASVDIFAFFLRSVAVFPALLYRASELDLFLHEARLVLTVYRRKRVVS